MEQLHKTFYFMMKIDKILTYLQKDIAYVV